MTSRITQVPTSATAAAITVFLRTEERLESARAGLGRSIRHRRQALQITGSALAILAQVNESELSKLERGQLARGIDLAQKVDAALTAIERERAERITAKAS